jgi:Bacterial Ig-like domain (group 3)/FG-GAP-like repeat/FG-GAP repeat
MRNIQQKILAGLMVLFAAPLFASASTPTTTTLTLSPSDTVSAGTVVTLTASVSNPAPVARGTVNFCNASMPVCLKGDGLYGSAQLTSVGTASVKMIFGVGAHDIRAVFLATSANAASASVTSTLTVTPSQIDASSTSLAVSGSAGDYTLSGTVSGYGNQPLTGTVSFLDTTNSNAQIGSASLGTPSYVMTSPVTYTTGVTPTVAVADINGDGIPDAVTGNYGNGSGSTISVFLGTGTGSFSSQATYPAGTAPLGTAIADFNGDGIADVVVADYGGAAVSVLLGKGDGTFEAAMSSPAGTSPSSLAVGDLNGDGVLDVVVTNQQTASISVLFGKGDGTFQSPVTYASGKFPQWVAVGDFNGDGVSDLAVANFGDDTVSVYLGAGGGSFHPQVTFATQSGPQSVSVGDFNGDGKQDLVLGNDNSNTVSVLLGNGDGSFQPQVAYATGTYPQAATVADINNDGIPDIVVVNASSNSISFLLGLGDGAFQPQITYATGSIPDSFAVADFNGDGIADLATASGNAGATISVLLGAQTANFSASNIAASLPVSTHNVLASYSGDSSRLMSRSMAVPLTATKATPSITVSCSPNPIIYASGASTSCPAHLSSGTGTVTFTILQNGYTVTSTVDSSGNATFGGFELGNAGSYTVRAVYSGDSNNNSVTATTTMTISPAPTVTTLTSSSGSITYGGSTVLTALVSNEGNETTEFPTGSVTFTSNGVSIGSAPVSTVTTTNLVPYSTAFSTWGISGTEADNAAVAPNGTNTAAILTGNGDGWVATGGNPGFVVGRTYTESVWLRVPTGTAFLYLYTLGNPGTEAWTGCTVTTQWRRCQGTFVANETSIGMQIDGASHLASGQQLEIWGAQMELGATAGPYVATKGASASGSGAVATLTTNILPTGSDSIIATYAGDANDLSSSSPALMETVNKATATITVSCSPNSFVYGSAGTYCVVTVPDASGTVTLTNNGGGWTSGPVGSNGEFGIGGFAGAPVGTYTIGAAWSGDGNYTAGSASTTFTITKATATVNLSSTYNPSLYGDTVTFTATVSAGATGTVTFSDGSNTLATVPLTGTSASYTSSALNAGSHNITASYSGDANFY